MGKATVPSFCVFERPTAIKIKRAAFNNSGKYGEVSTCPANREEQNMTFTQTA